MLPRLTCLLRRLRTGIAVLVVVAAVAAAPGAARADIGVGLFLGQPTGLDLKIDLAQRSALDIVLGWTNFDDGDDDFHRAYGHVTYLLTPFVAQGRSVLVPFRLGIGGAFYDGAGDFGDEINLAVRAPLEVALVFRKVPLEIYGELAIKITLLDDKGIDDDDVDADGGIGFRVYF